MQGFFPQLIEFYTPLISEQHADQPLPRTTQHKTSLSLQWREDEMTGSCTSILNTPHVPHAFQFSDITHVDHPKDR